MSYIILLLVARHCQDSSARAGSALVETQQRTAMVLADSIRCPALDSRLQPHQGLHRGSEPQARRSPAPEGELANTLGVSRGLTGKASGAKRETRRAAEFRAGDSGQELREVSRAVQWTMAPLIIAKDACGSNGRSRCWNLLPRKRPVASGCDQNLTRLRR
jgi:hypothetical protein